MIEHRKAYRDPFHLRSSIFVFFSHTPTHPYPHTMVKFSNFGTAQ